MGRAPASPRSVWVVIGPFMGWTSQLVHGMPTPGPPVLKSEVDVAGGRRRKGLSFGGTVGSSGFERSHARLSKSPKMWQGAAAVAPRAGGGGAARRERRPPRARDGGGGK